MSDKEAATLDSSPCLVRRPLCSAREVMDPRISNSDRPVAAMLDASYLHQLHLAQDVHQQIEKGKQAESQTTINEVVYVSCGFRSVRNGQLNCSLG